MAKEPIVITITDKDGQVSINGNVSSFAVLGYLEYAKRTILKDLTPTKISNTPPIENPIPEEEQRIESDGTLN